MLLLCFSLLYVLPFFNCVPFSIRQEMNDKVLIWNLSTSTEVYSIFLAQKQFLRLDFQSVCPYTTSKGSEQLERWKRK